MRMSNKQIFALGVLSYVGLAGVASAFDRPVENEIVAFRCGFNVSSEPVVSHLSDVLTSGIGAPISVSTDKGDAPPIEELFAKASPSTISDCETVVRGVSVASAR